MAIPQGSAPARPRAGSPAPSNAPAASVARSGVIRVRARHTGHFTVLANRLARRAGSAVTIGVAAYVFSLPDGAPISIKALCAHFDEGEVLIGRALRELEADGWIERRVERTAGGRIRTRTFVYDDPGAGHSGDQPTHRTTAPLGAAGPAQPTAGRPETVAPAHVPAHVSPSTEIPNSPAAQAPQPLTTDDRNPAAAPCAPPPPADGVPDPRPVAVLRSLHTRDARLTLTEPEIRQLAPAVGRWLALGAGSTDIAEALSTGLPAHFDRRPARLLAYRLSAWQPPGPHTPPPTPTLEAALPLRTCEGCDRAFRSPEPARCRDCRNRAGIAGTDGLAA